MLHLAYDYPADLPADCDPAEYADLSARVARLALTPALVPTVVQMEVVRADERGLDYRQEGRALLLAHCPGCFDAPAPMRASRYQSAEQRYNAHA